MKLKIATGHELFGGRTIHEFDEVHFIAEDGRTMFTVRAQADGRSIEVRAVETTMINGTLYDDALRIAPRSSNSIVVSVPEYPK